MDDFKGLDISRIVDQVSTLLTDPTSNLRAAMLLYGLIGVVVLVVLVAAIGFLMGFPDDEDEEYDDVLDAPESDPPAAVAVAAADAGDEATEEQAPRSRSQFAGVSFVVAVAIVAAAWALAGYTTSTDEVCVACHVRTVHPDQGGAKDPHESSSCVSCHEPGGTLGRLVGTVPSRMAHFIWGATGRLTQTGYGRVVSSACSECHWKDTAKISLNSTTGVRMSHAEPLAASVTCLECHRINEGVISRRTTGMGSCLKCHDAVIASSECSMCHDRKTAAAARARTTSFAKPQVPDVKCGACHDEAAQCDSCHGMRMPHSLAFKAGGHARAGAVDFWFNGGRTCPRCHTAARRPCTKCHTPILGKGHPATQATAHQAATPDRCGCHDAMIAGVPKGRNFCELCHSDEAKKESPR